MTSAICHADLYSDWIVARKTSDCDSAVGCAEKSCGLTGCGGLLDRFDSLILVSPAFFHFVGYFRGFGLDQPVRLFF